MTMNIQGRKKGGGRAPQEAADTLRSTQIAELQILISEGECQGLVNGLKSVTFDGVPVENADDSRNFENVDFAYTVGTQGQAALPGINATSNEIAVGLQVTASTPVTRTITNTLVDHVRVTVATPQLTEQNASTGDLIGSQVTFAIEVQANGAGFVEKFRDTIDGKTTSNYARAVKIQLSGSAPWDIRVKRITPDPTSSAIVNRINWQSYTEIISVKLRYPNSAMAGLRANAQNFGRIPLVGFDWMGIRCQVPVNYDPIARTYSGVWNGTFKIAWTNSLPWVLYDVITNNRYGLGDFIAPGLNNKWALYAIAQYCDELVPDGRGGAEPRFTCNLVLNEAREAIAVLRDLAAVCRAILFWSAGGIEFSQDAPGSAVALYTPANVVDGLFSYSDVSDTTLRSSCTVWWNDLAQQGKAIPETYTDEELVARIGVRETELRPLATWSRGQAARLARWVIESQKLLPNVVTFAVGSDGVACAPGKLLKIADPSEAGERLGGRIRSATTGAVTLDAPVTLNVGETYTLTVLQPDPAAATKLLTEARTVSTAAGTVQTLSVTPAFSAAPTPEMVWVLESNLVAATLWRCLTIEEVKGKNQFAITAVEHEPGLYARVEQGLKLDRRPISRITLVPPKVASLAFIETPYKAGAVTKSRVLVSWPVPGQGLSYQVSWRIAGGPWTDEPVTSANSIEVAGLDAGLFELQVQSINSLGNASPATSGNVTLVGAGSLTLTVGGQNLVPNSSFERDTNGDGLSDRWSYGTGGVGDGGRVHVLSRVAPLGQGQFAQRLAITSTTNLVDSILFSPVLPVPNGAKSLCVSALVRSNSLGAQLNVRQSSASAILLDSTATVPAVNTAQRLVVVVPVQGGAVTVQLQFRGIDDPGEWIEVDDVQLREGDTLPAWAPAPDDSLPYTWDQAADPALTLNVFEGDYWRDRSGAPAALKVRKGGAWVVVGTEGTSDLVLVARGSCQVVGNSAAKGGVAVAWDSDVYSRDSYTAGAFASAVAGPALAGGAAMLMFGLNSDPLTDQDYASLDYAVYLYETGQLLARDPNGAFTTIGTYAEGDVLVVLYDNTQVKWLKNGQVLRAVAAAPGLTFFFDSSFVAPGARINNIRFGPLSARTRIWRQAAAPTGVGEIDGDSWFDSDDGNKEYAREGGAWVSVRDAGISQALAAASTAQSTADGKINSFYQTSAPAGLGEDEGDLWFDTDDGNRLYVYRGGWTQASDTRIGAAVSAAATAQSTADGKIVTFFGASAPTALGVGDLWFRTTDQRLLRWSGSAWVVQTTIGAGDVSTSQLAVNSATRVTQDDFDLGGATFGGVGTATLRTLTLTPPANCTIELTGKLVAQEVNDALNIFAWWDVSDGTAAPVKAIEFDSLSSVKQVFSGFGSYVAAGGVALTIRLRATRSPGSPTTVWKGSLRMTEVYR